MLFTHGTMLDELVRRLDLPSLFEQVPYNGAVVPRLGMSYELSRGANCQVYAYALLGHFGVAFPPLRSGELWADETVTLRVATFEPLDLLLFNKTSEPFGAHVALCIGDGLAVHLSKAVGKPAIWPIDTFAGHEAYRVLLGGKRPRPAFHN